MCWAEFLIIKKAEKTKLKHNTVQISVKSLLKILIYLGM
jgi:hypothetical protein